MSPLCCSSPQPWHGLCFLTRNERRINRHFSLQHYNSTNVRSLWGQCFFDCTVECVLVFSTQCTLSRDEDRGLQPLVNLLLFPCLCPWVVQKKMGQERQLEGYVHARHMLACKAESKPFHDFSTKVCFVLPALHFPPAAVTRLLLIFTHAVLLRWRDHLETMWLYPFRSEWCSPFLHHLHTNNSLILPGHGLWGTKFWELKVNHQNPLSPSLDTEPCFTSRTKKLPFDHFTGVRNQLG